jgi:hypothetical protein
MGQINLTVSSLILELQEVLDKYGDLPIQVLSDDPEEATYMLPRFVIVACEVSPANPLFCRVM